MGSFRGWVSPHASFNSHPASGAEDGLEQPHVQRVQQVSIRIPPQGRKMARADSKISRRERFQFASRLRGGRWLVTLLLINAFMFQFASRLRGGRWFDQGNDILQESLFQFASRLRGGRWTRGSPDTRERRSFNSHPASGAEDGISLRGTYSSWLFQFASRLRGGRWEDLLAIVKAVPGFNSHPASGAEDGPPRA